MGPLHGGTIAVESKPGSGSQFTFTLPTAEGRAQPLNANLSKVRDTTPLTQSPVVQLPVVIGPSNDNATDLPLKILIVDDEPVNRQVLANLLDIRRYLVIEAQDGPSALELVKSEKPDMVLLDIMMPRMNGYEVCRRLREQHSLSELPVIMLTAKNQVNDLLEGMNSGASDYLPKPFNRDELLARMRTHLQLLRINDACTRFVPAGFLKFLGKESIVDVGLGDQTQQEMTVLFSDLRDFSSLSETMTPAENFAFLNAIFRRVGPVSRHNGGVWHSYRHADARYDWRVRTNGFHRHLGCRQSVFPPGRTV